MEIFDLRGCCDLATDECFRGAGCNYGVREPPFSTDLVSISPQSPFLNTHWALLLSCLTQLFYLLVHLLSRMDLHGISGEVETKRSVLEGAVTVCAHFDSRPYHKSTTLGTHCVSAQGALAKNTFSEASHTIFYTVFLRKRNLGILWHKCHRFILWAWEQVTAFEGYV